MLLMLIWLQDYVVGLVLWLQGWQLVLWVMQVFELTLSRIRSLWG